MPHLTPLPPLRRWHLAALALIVISGGLIRLALVLPGDFPLNDGGLFTLMAQEVRQAGFGLPAVTAYNGRDIPFVYPPLAFFVLNWLADGSGLPLIEWVRMQPALFSILTLPPFFLLARRLLRSNTQALLATAAFALTPRSMVWMIMGGGVTRSMGFCFALWTLWAAHRLYTERRILPSAPLTAVFAGLTVLSHTEMAWFTLLSALLFWLWWGRSAEMTLTSGFIAAGVIYLSSPWWMNAVGQHGLAPFLNAFSSNGEIDPLRLLLLPRNFTDEPMLGLLAILGLVGMLVSIASQRWFLVAWLALLAVFNGRSVATTGLVPLMLALAVALDEVLLRYMRAIGERRWSAVRLPWRRQPVRLVWLPSALTLAAIFAYGLLGPFQIPRYFGAVLYSLEPEQRLLMEWIRNQTPAEARFAVITSAPAWEIDAISEWFPALTARQSVGTVQGTEWLPDGQFRQDVQHYYDLQWCAAVSTGCLEDWARAVGRPYEYVYVTYSVSGALITALEVDPDYRLVLDVGGIRLYEFVGAL